MTFNDILQSDTVASEKLKQLAELVYDIREAYGNTDVTIDIPYVNTPDGMVSLTYLDADSKVAFAGQSVRAITIEAIEICEATQGAMLDKEIESLVATCPILCNLSSTTGSKYL